MAKNFIRLKHPSAFICSDDMPCKDNYVFSCRYYINAPKTSPVSEFKATFERITADMRNDYGNDQKWENIVLAAHGGGNLMGMYGNITKDNLKAFAAPMRGKVKDIWLLSCSMGSALNGVAWAVNQVNPSWMQYVVPSYEWDVESNSQLAAAFERIKPGSVNELRTQWAKVGGNLSQSLRRDACYIRWIDLNAMAAVPKNTWVAGFASLLALDTGANVWASPHVQAASIIQLVKGTIDGFEGDLYKYPPGQVGHLVSRRPLYSVS
jgi:hypothetical protein